MDILSRTEDMKIRTERWYRIDRCLAKTTTAEESDQSNRPYSSMKMVGNSDGPPQRQKVLDGNGSTKWALVSRTFFVRRNASHFYPVVVAVPRGMIREVPGANTGEPRFDGLARSRSLVITNKCTQKGIWGRHTSALWDLPSVAELVES